MADNMCGPSNAAKGLVGHFDQNRSLQQDRLANVRPSASSSFRSAPRPAPGTGDAAFAAFQAGTDGNLALAPAPAPVFMSPAAPGAYYAAPLRQAPITHTPAVAAREVDPPTWVIDFNKIHLANDPDYVPPGPSHPVQGHSTGPVPNALSHNVATYGAPIAGPAPGPVGYAFGSIPQAAQLPYMSQPGVANTQVGPQYNQYPHNLRLANSTEEALEAAFAEYDEDFHAHQDQWMAQHGPAPEEAEEAEIQARMSEIAIHQEAHRSTGQAEKDELRDAALSILSTIGLNNPNTKFKHSSFVELMKRISNRRVFLAGDDLIDAETGESIQPIFPRSSKAPPKPEPAPKEDDIEKADRPVSAQPPVV